MPRASAPPGAGLRRPAKVRRTSSSGRTAGERSVARTYKALPKPPTRRASMRLRGQGPNVLVRGLTIESIAANQRFNNRAKREIAQVLKRLRATNPNFAAKLAKSDPSYALSSTTMPKKAAGIYDSEANSVSLDPFQTIALTGAWGKKAQDAAKQVLFHEQAHANQFQVDKTPKRDWQVEAQAEIKARKIAQRMLGKAGSISYEDFVKKYLNRKLGR